jgi:teichuronic acid biosynthesis glycosyltransferase TuaG
MEEHISTQEDYVLWLKILREGKLAHGLNEMLMFYRVRKNSLSSNKLRTAKDQWRVYREFESLPLAKCIYYFMFYVYKGYKKFTL